MHSLFTTLVYHEVVVLLAPRGLDDLSLGVGVVLLVGGIVYGEDTVGIADIGGGKLSTEGGILFCQAVVLFLQSEIVGYRGDSCIPFSGNAVGKAEDARALVVTVLSYHHHCQYLQQDEEKDIVEPF